MPPTGRSVCLIRMLTGQRLSPFILKSYFCLILTTETHCNMATQFSIDFPSDIIS